MEAILASERQDRCMVSHWYNPAYLIPIAELSKFGNMPEEVFQEVYDLYVACEKQPVRVLKDITGMVANRILHAQARECFYLAEIGAALPEDIDKALKYGPCFRNATTGMLEVADMGGLDVWLAAEDNMFPALCNADKACDAMRKLVPCFRNATTGMLEVADMGGLDVWLAAEDNMFPALCNADKACDAMRKLVAEGKIGIKSGQGFFDYPEEVRAKAQDEFYKRLIVQLKASKYYERRA